MQSQLLHPSLQWRYLLLVFMVIPVAAAPEEDWYGVLYENNNSILIVDLGGTQLIGPLVPDLEQLSHLAFLQLGYNGFSGPIPEEFENLLNGSIPASLGKLTTLKFLDLNDNALTGSMSQELLNLLVLTNLTLSFNGLWGPIPFTSGLVNNLGYIDLNYNNFSVPYTKSLTSFPFHSTVNLESNLISTMLNISRILELLSAIGAKNNLIYILQTMSLKDNNITDVSVAIGSLQIPSTSDIRRCLYHQDFLCYLRNYLKSPFPYTSPSLGSHTNFIGIIIGVTCGTIFLLAIFIGVIKTKLARSKLSKSEDKYKQSVYDTQDMQSESFSLLQYENMDSKFSDALRIINNVKALDKRSFHINNHQCMRLVEFYMKVGEFLESAKEACEDFSVGKAILSLDATLSVLQKGQVLLTKYTKDDWHIILMSGGVNQGSFDAIHLELEACIQSIREFLEEKVPRIKLLPFMQRGYLGTPLLLLAERDRATILGGDADKDKKDILAKVKSTRQETNNTRSLTKEAKSSKILSLEIASQYLQDEKPTPTSSTKFEELPTVLRINPSYIELGEPLGSGGSAEVLKCRWSDVNCAVKILKRGDVNGLRAEVGKLMELRHPNIVTLFGFSIGKGGHEGRPMVVMELLNGDLSLLQHQLKFNLSKAVDVMHKIATGMAYLHNRGIFHGDLKSMNVLVNNLTGLFEVKISDFGVSQHIYEYPPNHDTNDSNISAINTKSFNGRVGTPMWMAPEVLTSSGDGNIMYSAKADVYSFAMVCVEILTGKLPYNQSLAKIRDVRAYVVDEGERPTLPLSLPSDLRELIGQCWDKDPELRPNFHQICARLQKLQAHSSPLQKWGWKLALCSKKLCRLDWFLDN